MQQIHTKMFFLLHCGNEMNNNNVFNFILTYKTIITSLKINNNFYWQIYILFTKNIKIKFFNITK